MRVLYQYGHTSTVNLASAWLRQCSAPSLRMPVLSALNASSSGMLLRELILPYSHKFKSLNLSMYDTAEWKGLLTLPFDTLTTLSLSLRNLPLDGRFYEITSAPFLCNVNITGILDMGSLPKLPWEQLTSLHLFGTLAPDEISEILTRCASLQVCELDMVDESEEYPSLYTPASVPMLHLASLRITFCSAESLGWLCILNTPNLSLLTIPGLPRTEKPRHDYAIYFRNISALRHFIVQPFQFPEDTLSRKVYIDEGIIQAIPFVTELVLPYNHYLTPRTAAKVVTGELLPNIEHLEFSGDIITPIVDSLMTRGTSQTSHLRKVVIHTDISNEEWNNPLINSINVLWTQGLEIDVKYHSD